jgi:hypothetical protein
VKSWEEVGLTFTGSESSVCLWRVNRQLLMMIMQISELRCVTRYLAWIFCFFCVDTD